MTVQNKSDTTRSPPLTPYDPTTPTTPIATTGVVELTLGPILHDIGKSGDDGSFVCVCMDWWPANKCNYGVCPWGNASILTTNLESIRLQNLLKEFTTRHHGGKTLTVRIGGTQADTIVYQDNSKNCLPFVPPPPQPASKFQHGCLTQTRWKQIAQFAKQTNLQLIFGINAMFGRQNSGDAWNSSNARQFLEFLRDENLTDNIVGFELGNELNMVGMTGHEHAHSFLQLDRLLKDVFGESNRFRLLGPDNFDIDNHKFYQEFLPLVNETTLWGLTWHSYPLGAGYNNPDLIHHIMNPSFLDRFGDTMPDLVKDYSPNLKLVMGETGGAYNSGHDGITNRFVDAFWYLAAMGKLAKNHHSMFCRQTLLGGNYELIDKTTHYPNPSYFAALLFQRIMGRQVRQVRLSSYSKSQQQHQQHNHHNQHSDHIRAFCHCNLEEERLGLLILNYQTKNTTSSTTTTTGTGTGTGTGTTIAIHGYTHQDLVRREEYQITAKSLFSSTDDLKLNGKPIRIQSNGTFELSPRIVSSSDDNKNRPIIVPPESYLFVYFSKESTLSQQECSNNNHHHSNRNSFGISTS